MTSPSLTDARTPHTGLPYLYPGQAQKEAFINEALARLDALVHASVIGERNDPPANAETGDSYIVGPEPVEAWADCAGWLAAWSGTSWLLTSPSQGARVFDQHTGSVAVFDTQAGWSRAAAPIMPVSGDVRDTECRAALAAIVAGLQRLGIFQAPQEPT